MRYIITVSKLKEGWDCPFAYVLCSVADQVSPVAVEQILGRILRMPQAKRKRRDALNQSYAYIVSRSFDPTAQQLKTSLVEGAGFNRLEADDIVAPQQNLGFSEEADTYQHQSDPLPEETAHPETIIAAIAKLPPSVKTRVSFDADTRTLSYTGPMTRESRNLLHLGAPPFLSGLDANMQATLTRFWHAKQQPEKAARLKVMQGVRDMIEKRAGLVFREMEKAVGMRPDRVRELRNAKTEAEKAFLLKDA